MTVPTRFDRNPRELLHVMPAHRRPKDGVASLAYVAGIHALAPK
jgi:hypothetical protein